MSNKRFKWPEGKKYGVVITVNLEAQYFAKMYYPDDDIDLDQGEISLLGKEAMTSGLEKLLDLLDEYKVKATFFTLGAICEQYPDKVKDIANRGHEIGCHGYYHENFALMSVEEQMNVLKASKLKIEDTAGKIIKGFRMPEGEITEDTYNVLKELGFIYSSSLSDNDIPYIKTNGIVELPIHWELYDLPYFAYTFDPPIPQSQGRSSNANDVLENWMYELEGARRYGTLMNIQLDPQSIGEQGRIFILEKLLQQICSDESAWVTLCEEITKYTE